MAPPPPPYPPPVKQDQASSTARLIAAAQIIASREPRLHHLVDFESADLSHRLLIAARGDWLAVAANSFFGRRLLLGFERVMLRGLIWHWLHRKRRIEELVREALSEGFSQLLILGAGLDTLPLRLAAKTSPPNIICIDHPATQRAVSGAFPELDRPESRVRLIPMNLSTESLGANQALAAALAEQPTIVLAEGLLMYLSPDRVGTLLREIVALPAPRLRVILTAMDSPAGQPISFRPRSPRADRWLAKRSEPMRSSIPAGREVETLARAGLRHTLTITARELRGSKPGLDGEDLLVAER